MAAPHLRTAPPTTPAPPRPTAPVALAAPRTSTTASATEKTTTRTSTSKPAGGFSSCAEAKKAGAAPLHVGEPGYSSKLDRDGDGVACER